MELTKKQTIALDLLEDTSTRDLLYGGAAGGGKSVLGCYWHIKRRIKYPGTRGLIGRSELKALRETTLNSFFEVCKLQNLSVGKHFVYNAQLNIIKWFNGSETYLKDLYQYPSDPNFDSLGSLEITDAFVDECPQITERAWNVTKSRIRFKLDEYGLVPKILGTCNPSKGWTYNYFYKLSKENKLPKGRRFVQALLSDNRFISEHYRENLLSLSKFDIERLLNGNWEYDDDPAVLCNYESILNMFTNDFVSLSGNKYITCDVARLGSDKIVIGLWNGWRVKIWEFSKKRITESYEFIESLRKEHGVSLSNVIADEDGVGGGLVDMLKCKGFVNNSSPIKKENYENLQAQCAFKLAERINRNGVYIENANSNQQTDIVEELEQLKQKNIDLDGKKGIVPKDKVKEIIGRSPDYRDMLLMRMWFELNQTVFIVE